MHRIYNIFTISLYGGDHPAIAEHLKVSDVR